MVVLNTFFWYVHVSSSSRWCFCVFFQQQLGKSAIVVAVVVVVDDVVVDVAVVGDQPSSE